MKTEYLIETPMLDFQAPIVQRLIEERQWLKLTDFDKIKSIYDYVRDEISFGYNSDDTLPASLVLQDGYGQCNTKGTLLMALLRAVGIPTRFHGFTIFNDLQKGAIPSYLFYLAPDKIIHSWVEVYYQDHWYNLEGYIIDKPYLFKIQSRFGEQCDSFSGYGIATPCLKNPPIEWQASHTYIQKEGIADDFGIYAQPDDFYKQYGTNLNGLKKFLFKHFLRHLMNTNVNRIRQRGIP